MISFNIGDKVVCRPKHPNCISAVDTSPYAIVSIGAMT